MIMEPNNAMVLDSASAVGTNGSIKKKVSFEPMVTVQVVEKLFSTQDERSGLYYSFIELNKYSRKVKKATQKLLSLVPPKDNQYMLGLESNPSCRGLEQYLYPIRVQNKILMRMCLIKYQRNLMHHHVSAKKTDEEKHLCLAALSTELSQWSKSVAMETARLDSLQAWDQRDYNIPICGKSVVISPFPLSRTRKRINAYDEGNSQPPKRQRLSNGAHEGVNGKL